MNESFFGHCAGCPRKKCPHFQPIPTEWGNFWGTLHTYASFDGFMLRAAISLEYSGTVSTYNKRGPVDRLLQKIERQLQHTIIEINTTPIQIGAIMIGSIVKQILDYNVICCFALFCIYTH